MYGLHKPQLPPQEAIAMVAFNDKKKSTVPSDNKGFGLGSSINSNRPAQPSMFGKTLSPYGANVKSEGGSPIRKPEHAKSITPASKTYPPMVSMRGGKGTIGMPQSKNTATIKKITGKKSSN